jgi:glycosyltransferase involved in cell wall biosynthesis
MLNTSQTSPQAVHHTTPMRVLIATPRFLPHMGGVENHVYQVSRRLLRDGHQVRVLTADASGKLPPAETIDGIRIERFPARPQNSDVYFAPALGQAIRAAAAERAADVLHVQNYLTAVAPIAMAAARRVRLPYVVTFHGGGHSQSWRNAIRRAQGLALRPLLMGASQLVATARFEVEHYGQRLGLPCEKFVYIPNGCDIHTGHIESTPNREHPLIISMGRLERYKGHQRVLAAMPHVLRQQPAARLRLLGNGPYEAELRAMTSKLGLEGVVEIGGLPMADRNGMARTLSTASLVVLMSEFETHPMGALEAIALGCNTLVAQTSGLSELAENGWARAVALDASPETLAQAMLAHLMSTRPAGWQAPQLPTWDDCTHELVQLYRTHGVRAPQKAAVSTQAAIIEGSHV